MKFKSNNLKRKRDLDQDLLRVLGHLSMKSSKKKTKEEKEVAQ